MKNSQLMGRGALPRPRRKPTRRGNTNVSPAPPNQAELQLYSEPAVMYTPGRCRVCGCTESEPCALGAGFYCWWVDAARTLCSAPKCLALFPIAELERAAGIKVAHG